MIPNVGEWPDVLACSCFHHHYHHIQVNLRNAYPKIAYCRQFWGRHFWVNPSSEMPTPVILYIFTFLFIFLWPFGVNILESVCLLLSNLVLYFWDELNISKKVTEIQSTLIHYDKNNIFIFCPSRGLLGYPQPWRCQKLPPWPGAVFCYEFFTKIISFSFRALPATSTDLSRRKLRYATSPTWVMET